MCFTAHCFQSYKQVSATELYQRVTSREYCCPSPKFHLGTPRAVDSSQSDMLRFVKSSFNCLHQVEYLAS